MSIRLLNKNCVSKEDRHLITLLSPVIGENTAKLFSRMFDDVEASLQLSAEYQQNVNRMAELKFSITMINSSFWPRRARIHVRLPPLFKTLSSNFELFYKARHQHREVKWLHHQSVVELTTQNLPKTHTLRCTLHQAIILCLFNHQPSLSIEEIASMTDIPVPALQKQLKPLFFPKFPLLVKTNG